MNIILNTHAYVPHWNAGAQKSFHDLALWLTSRGHKVDVIAPAVAPYVYEGISVHKEGPDNEPLWRSADVIFTQLNCTGRTINFAKYFNKPVIHFARNDNNYDMVRFRSPMSNYIVYNSEWVRESLDYPLNSFVLPPTVDYRHYDVGGNPYGRKCITLINHNENKGANQVIEIARRMPERQFLFVDGGYGDQITADLPNLVVWPNQADIREAYKVTRILLMPSKYESWGRTCTEAMCNGIPVIHSCTPGLMENTGGHQVCVGRDNTDGWVDAINALDNDELYTGYSANGRTRAKELDPEKALQGLEAWLKGMLKYRKNVAA